MGAMYASDAELVMTRDTFILCPYICVAYIYIDE